MKYISLFAGIGGFDVALDRLGHTCVFANDNNQYCKYVYDYHFSHKLNNSDIRDVETKTIPEHDLLVAGFPCQSFSIAGKRKGFEDTRGTMFFEVARILKDRTPAYVLLENVKGLLTHESGRTFETILRALDELGYDIQWQVLNSKNYGVAQNRERIFIIGHFRGKPRYKIFPFTAYNSTSLRELTKDQPQGQRLYDTAGLSTTIAGQGGGNGAKTGLYIMGVPRGKNKGYTGAIAPTITGSDYQHNNHVVLPVITPDRPNKRQNGRRFKGNGDPSFTLTAQDRHGVMISKTIRVGGRSSPYGSKQNWNSYEFDGIIRRLTPIECERLQGFPDNWTKIGVQLYTNKVGNSYMREIPITDTQRYKMLGNAVTVNVVATILQDFVKI